MSNCTDAEGNTNRAFVAFMSRHLVALVVQYESFDENGQRFLHRAYRLLGICPVRP